MSADARKHLLGKKETTSVNKSGSEADELEPIVGQTHFAEDVVIEDIRAAGPTHETESSQNTPWWKQKRIILLGAVILVGCIMMVIALSLQQSMTDLPTQQPSQQETTGNSEEEISELRRQLLLLEQDIEAADPLEAELAFPPVTFDKVLEDALSAERLQDLQEARR
ncbi:hypothetical protein LRY65_05405 [Candidatus Woesebacteria bacterium]|nr:hypothetical protein [Candidatus Woesebacteria bacterium]MCD8506699.1 hypothetical protein [Candidatus Woesebacteria bacterium]MCD8527605.1 hypothetical protein [Candidatus Woesebacteria bacterium]MCD8546424.1 hypothetical protein [Candidatus Woesebacteria bacterium]